MSAPAGPAPVEQLPPDAPPLPDEWARLHPLSPVVRFGRAVAVLLVVVVPRLLVAGSTPRGRGGDSTQLWIEAAAVGIGLVTGVVAWLVTRWRVSGTDLQVESGLLRRQSVRIPVARIQAIDVVRPFAARLFGLSELRVAVAGSGASRGRLAYLPQRRAAEVRAQLLALAHGLPGETPEPPQQRQRWLAAVDNRRLVVATALGAPTLVLLVLLIGAGAAGLATGRLGPSLAGVLGPAIPVALLIARRINSEFSQQVSLSPDGLRVVGGLLETRAETIPAGRVQAWRWSEPLLWRPFGWVRIEVDVAQQRAGRRGDEGDAQRTQRALLPVGTREQARELMRQVAAPTDPRLAFAHRPPRRALVKAPISFVHLGFAHDGTTAFASSGRLVRQVVLVPLEKVQSLRTVQGPVARRLRLATLHLDVAGRRWRAAAHARDATEVDALLAELTVLCRERRRSAEPGMQARS